MSYADDHLIPLVDEGLGNSAYLADLGGGRALAVDASRDLRALRQAAARRGLTVERHRFYTVRREPDVYPTAEELFVAAPGVVAEKARTSFECGSRIAQAVMP